MKVFDWGTGRFVNYKPENNRRKGRPTKYPWNDMEIGQEFTVPSEQATPASMRSLVGYMNRESGRKFSIKTEIGLSTIKRVG